jgi:hypothetical protein
MKLFCLCSFLGRTVANLLFEPKNTIFNLSSFHCPVSTTLSYVLLSELILLQLILHLMQRPNPKKNMRPYAGVNSNTCTMGIPKPGSTLTLCQSRLCPSVSDLGFGLCFLIPKSALKSCYSSMNTVNIFNPKPSYLRSSLLKKFCFAKTPERRKKLQFKPEPYCPQKLSLGFTTLLKHSYSRAKMTAAHKMSYITVLSVRNIHMHMYVHTHMPMT